LNFILIWTLAPAGMAKAEGWTPEAMFQVKLVGDVQVSPDGKKVAYAIREAVMNAETSEFTAQVHVADADGGNAYQLTQGEASSAGPQWAPDGERIAFLSKRSGKSQVWIIALKGGEARQLTNAEGGVVSVRWAPDGKRVAYVATDPKSAEEEQKSKAKDDARVVDQQIKRNRLYVLELDDKGGKQEGRKFTEGDLSVHGEFGPGFDWSPDGKTIVFAHTPTPGADDWIKSDISVVDLSSGTVKPLAHTGRAESAPYYSPDGRLIAYVASDDPPSWAWDYSVYAVPSEGGTPRKLANTFDHRPELLGWSAQGDRLFYRENRGTTTRLYALPLNGEPVAIGPEDGVVTEPSLNSSRSIVGFSYQTASQPTEAYLIQLGTNPSAATPRPNAATQVDRARAGASGNKPVQVSHANKDLPDLPLGRTEAIHYKAADGQEIEGLLTYPVGYQQGKKYPLLLNIHGGPASVFFRTFIGAAAVSSANGRHSTSAYPIAAFAAQGYAILRCNVRGSSGYGKEFRQANLKDWGGGDYRDLMAGVDSVIEQGIADPDRLGVMGWSYGGYMTTWVVGHTKRFKAASIGAPVTDLVSFSGTTDIPAFLPSYFGGEPWDHPGIYRDRSPIAHVQGVKTPTLLQQGDEDERVPIGQGYELYSALKRQGCTVKMVVYPRSHHSIQEPKLLLDAMKRNLEWFEKYVPGAESKTSGSN
jgi:dipeptidyl aminopeptidase/acylaminoacyl peptidase